MSADLSSPVSASEQTPPARFRSQISRSRRWADRLSAVLIRSGGIFVIVAILGILSLFLVEIAPLWKGADVELKSRFSLARLGIAESERILILDVEEYRQIGFALTDSGKTLFFRMEDGTPVKTVRLELQPNERLTAAWQSMLSTRFAAATNHGRVLYGEYDFRPHFVGEQRRFAPEVRISSEMKLDTDRPLSHLAVAGDPEESLVITGITGSGGVLVYQRQIEESLFGPKEVTENRYEIDDLGAVPTALVLESSGQAFFLGTDSGDLYKYTLSEDGLVRDGRYSASDTSITVLGFLIGERSLVVGDAVGRLTVWFESFDEGQPNVRSLKPVHRMQGHPTAVAQFTPSQRNRTFITASLDGLWRMQYSTNERLLYTGQHFNEAPALIRFAPKGNGVLFLDPQHRVWNFDIVNPHPEASWKTYFGKIWYEGYSKPDYVWQSSSGSDDFEPKLSLVPLIFGTLKGTFYAMLFAFPIAILAAVYVSQFLYPRWRSPIKSVMEIMAALPSVIIGFIGGLWLAPRVQDVAPAIFAMFIVIPTGVILVSWMYSRFSDKWPIRLEAGFEPLLIIPLVLILGWLCLQANTAIEQTLFAGDFRQWLSDTLNLHYDQRNAFVVGLVMGFAVIPLIFTIAEDALSNVPSSLSAASLALGATRWQTALFIVVPAAIPGIFSATMIGLGRAIGETMIVLMATGNTPVMDWNIFNGFRTLSANIAVEIPEAPQGGTLYRTLFLSALLLFLMTFVVNTLAEVVRMRMRKKYENM